MFSHLSTISVQTVQNPRSNFLLKKYKKIFGLFNQSLSKTGMPIQTETPGQKPGDHVNRKSKKAL